MKLWYDKPANLWTDALPLGNGRLGAMVFGGTGTERFALNDDTLWSGPPAPWDNPGALVVLPEARRAALEERYEDAHELCKGMQGSQGEAYLPLGDLFLDFGDAGDVSDYYRDLDLDSAIATTRYVANGATFTREAFVSAPDDVMVVRLTANTPGSLTLAVRFASQLRATTKSADDNTVRISGDAPTSCEPARKENAPPVYDERGGGIRFATEARAIATGGTVTLTNDGVLHIENADAVTLFVSAATSFLNPQNPHGRDAVATAHSAIDRAATHPYETLRARHVADYAPLFERVTLDLGDADSTVAALPTDERVRRYAETTDPALAALLFHFGRYLLIASSRPGTQPANLQGIWNYELHPPWSSNYTTNINTQMNYWLAETANLPDCHEPLLDFIRELSVPGATTARVNYGCGGWVAHHNVDLWRHSAPVDGSPSWANWPLGGAWLCRHLWEHYAFSGDADFLREAYPLMRGAAQFALDFLVEDGDGHLVTAPSTSPEHRFRGVSGNLCAVSVASTMDMAILRELFGYVADAAAVLQTDAVFAAECRAARARLYPAKTGTQGQILEFWREFVDEDVHHRHVSHLYGLFPGSEYSPHTTPVWCDAARKSLEIRGDAGTGWSLAWKICLWARLEDGDRAHALIGRLLTLVDTGDTHYRGGGGVYKNLFDAHPPFQIDGNFGFAAGVCEMLLQSHAGVTHLLPALPGAWHTGVVSGIRARGGVTVGIRWSNGALETATLRADRDTSVAVRYNGVTETVTLVAGKTTAIMGDVFGA